MLSVRVFAIRAVIASKLGMFLYPTRGFFSNGSTELSFSSFSAVRASPPDTEYGVSSLGSCGEAVASENALGDPDRVCGGFTANESAVETVVDREVLELVRRAKAANRGRLALGDGAELAPPAAFPSLLAVADMRAAS